VIEEQVGDTPGEQDRSLLDGLDDAWDQLRGLGVGLDARAWRTTTECPGWSVQDQYAHIAGFEHQLLGDPPPDHEPVLGTHVKNVIGEMNERWVDWYRQRPGIEVLEDFDAVTAARMAQLRAYSASDFAADSWTPAGPGAVRDLLGFRIFDAWVHSQDVRRALRVPGGFRGAAAQRSMTMIAGFVPFVVGKLVAPPEGTLVRISVTDVPEYGTAVRIVNGRGVPDTTPDDADVGITLDADTLVRLATGRGDPYMMIAGRVVFDGDATIGRAVVEQLNRVF